MMKNYHDSFSRVIPLFIRIKKNYIAGFEDMGDRGMINDILPAKTIAAGRNSCGTWDQNGDFWIAYRFQLVGATASNYDVGLLFHGSS